MRKIALGLFAVFIVAVVAVACWFVYGANEVASGQVGMAQLTLPSGKSVWIRRQSYAHTREHLYISESDDYCAPYSRWHDAKLPAAVTGAEDHPLLISFSGNTIVIHATEGPVQPLLHSSWKTEFQAIAPSKAAAYAAKTSPLPAGWQRIEVPWGHNTCSL